MDVLERLIVADFDEPSPDIPGEYLTRMNAALWYLSEIETNYDVSDYQFALPNLGCPPGTLVSAPTSIDLIRRAHQNSIKCKRPRADVPCTIDPADDADFGEDRLLRQ